MEIIEFQELIRKIYFEKDKNRGKSSTLLWLGEGLGELYEAYRKDDREGVAEELADIIARAASFANLEGIDLEEAMIKKYPGACYYCNSVPCRCKQQKLF